jgi:hypothetical protein
MKSSTLAVLLASLCSVTAVQATTYVRVEKDGTKTYSDRPIPGGQPVELQPAQTYSAPQTGTSSSRPREEQLLSKTDDFRYESCSVTPANDTTFQSPESVVVSVSTTPSQRPGDVITMTVDGQPAGGPNSLSYMMQPAYRGTHTVAVTVTNENGKTVCSSTSVFHVMQPGLNSPARQSSAPVRPPRPNVPRPTPN